MTRHWREIKRTDQRSFKAYVVEPRTKPAPAILLFHAIFGVNGVVQGVAERFADAGYLVVCPDLFWRQQELVQLQENRPEDWAAGLELFRNFDPTAGMTDLASALNFTRGASECNGRIGAVGYCFGGRMAYFMAACHDIDAAVSYYGTSIENHLNLAPLVKRPLMLHLAENDKYVPLEAQREIRDALSQNPNVSIWTYEGVDHAFARIGSPTFDAAAADLANTRTAEFLRRHLA